MLNNLFQVMRYFQQTTIRSCFVNYYPACLGAIGAVILLLSFCAPAGAQATGEAKVIIAKLSPQSAISASEEFIELYNAGDATANVAGWRVQYKSATGKSWSTKAVIGCPEAKACAGPEEVLIQPDAVLRLSSYESGDAVRPFRSGLATKGGQVRLVDASDSFVQIDMVGYGTAAAYEGQGSAVAPQPGQGIIRKQDEHGRYQDSNDNAVDFGLESDDGSSSGAVQLDEPPVAGDAGQDVTTEYYNIEITEVLPDPSSPQLDSKDEFIELYNPYDFEVNLAGYVLRTGANWSHKYVIDKVVIGSHDYLVLTSAQTGLSLSNSGSGVQLLGPDGVVRYEVPTYGKAKEGASWIRDANGQWAWTTEPTKGEENILAAETETTKKQPAAKAKTTSTAKKSAASSSKTAASVKAASTASQPGAGSDTGSTGAKVWPWVMLGVGTLAGGYAVFEYRNDIGNFLRRAWQALPGVSGKK